MRKTRFFRESSICKFIGWKLGRYSCENLQFSIGNFGMSHQGSGSGNRSLLPQQQLPSQVNLEALFGSALEVDEDSLNQEPKD